MVVDESVVQSVMVRNLACLTTGINSLISGMLSWGPNLDPGTCSGRYLSLIKEQVGAIGGVVTERVIRKPEVAAYFWCSSAA